jgi:hypothetical protein
MTGRPGVLMAVAAVSGSGASCRGPLRRRPEQRGGQLGMPARSSARRAGQRSGAGGSTAPGAVG